MRTDPSFMTVTSMRLQRPAIASSTELLTISFTNSCSPPSPVSPMYIAGRRRTPSRPFRTWISSEVYSEVGEDPLPPAATSEASASAM